MNIKGILSSISPNFLVEYHRRRMLLLKYGFPDKLAKGFSRTAFLVDCVGRCNYTLWPPSLKTKPYNWTLVDVGANEGSFLSAALSLVDPANIYVFEPQSQCVDKLRAMLKDNQAVQIIQAAVGSKTGEIELTCTKDDKFSSVLEPLALVQSEYSAHSMEIIERITIPLKTLDEELRGVDCIGLLKVDTQGYEIEVLKGGRDVLGRTVAVLLEVNYVPHYEGAATFDQVSNYLHARGFALAGVSAPYMGQRLPLWADALFVNKNFSELKSHV